MKQIYFKLSEGDVENYFLHRLFIS